MNKYGEVRSGALHDRLAEIDAAGSLVDLIVGDLRAIENATEQTFMLSIDAAYSLIFKANHPKQHLETLPRELSKIYRVQILEVCEHED